MGISYIEPISFVMFDNIRNSGLNCFALGLALTNEFELPFDSLVREGMTTLFVNSPSIYWIKQTNTILSMALQ